MTEELTQEMQIAFNNGLLKSQVDVLTVARYFVNKGNYDVTLPGMTLYAKFTRAPDDGDLVVTNTETGVSFRLEVKGHRKSPFEDMLKYPSLIVDRVSIYDGKIERGVKPDFYFILGQCRKKALLFDVCQWPVVRVTKQKHQITGELVDCYMAPRAAFRTVAL